MPDSIYKAAEELAQRLGISRSALYTKALADFIEKHKNDSVTKTLNEIYSEESSLLDPVLHSIQLAFLSGEKW